jgi:uncharacterized protein
MPGTVSNSTPLIHLAKIGQLELLRDFFGTLWIPPAVYRECVDEGKAYQEAALIERADWLKIQPVTNTDLVKLLKTELDGGESEAIALALAQSADLLLLDDSDGRSKARLYGLRCTGTIGILLRARQAGKISSFRHTLDALQAGGFWLDKRLYQALLQEAGEAG